MSARLDVSSTWFDALAPMMARVAIAPLPDADALQAALGDFIAPVRFERQTKKKRARGGAIVLDELYEARIARRGLIPTRTHVHDLMNALVWATFPRSKRALAERQYRALVAQIGEQPTALPNARTRERDVLAMIDEGGVLCFDGVQRVFGHAIFEHLATLEGPVRGFPIPLALARDADPAAIDRALVGWIEALDAGAIATSALPIDPRG